MYTIKHMPAQGAVLVFFPSCVFSCFHTHSTLEVATDTVVSSASKRCRFNTKTWNTKFFNTKIFNTT